MKLATKTLGEYLEAVEKSVLPTPDPGLANTMRILREGPMHIASPVALGPFGTTKPTDDFSIFHYAEEIGVVAGFAKMAAASVSPRAAFFVGAGHLLFKAVTARHHQSLRPGKTASGMDIVDLVATAVPLVGGVVPEWQVPGSVTMLAGDLVSIGRAVVAGKPVPINTMTLSHDPQAALFLKGMKLFGVTLDPDGASTSSSLVQTGLAHKPAVAKKTDGS